MGFMALLSSPIQGCHLLPDALNELEINMNHERHAKEQEQVYSPHPLSEEGKCVIRDKDI